jgi:putative thiamine transport system permease protein
MGAALHEMSTAEGRGLRLLVLLLVVGFIVAPILAGLWETGAAALGHLPAVGARGPSLDPWRQFLALPGVTTSIALTLWTGIASTFLSLALAAGLVAELHTRLDPRAFARLLTPILAAPHAAIAIGLAFVIAPSGWIARLVSPWATGWQVPPDIATVHDPLGLALIAGLVVKETPFLALVLLAAVGQLPVAEQMAAARALGYGRAEVWTRVILPQAYPLIRLPVMVVLAFGLSVVDMAIVLGPSNPPVLSVAVTRWLLSPDVRLILPASAGAVAQGGLALGAILLWLAAEAGVRRAGRAWLRRGQRGRGAAPLLQFGATGTLVALALGGLALIALLVWSFAWRWTFPDALPESWSLRTWMHPEAGWGRAALITLAIGGVSVSLSLLLAVLWLEGEDRAHMPRARWAEGLIYLPLIVPQIAFLYGLQVVFLRLGLSGGAIAVVWAQSLFVFPYVMIALSDPWRALDPRLEQAAAALGAGPLRRLFAVKLPCLLRPILTAAAVGFAVSAALYLPTLFMGAGRIATLTTEAVTLSSGSDRRVVGSYAVLQAALPMAAYGLALIVPAWVWRHRRALGGGLGGA